MNWRVLDDFYPSRRRWFELTHVSPFILLLFHVHFFFSLRKQRRERNNKSKQSWFVTAPATTTYVSASRDATRTQNVWMLENLKGKHIKFIRIYRVCMNYIRLAISLRRGKCGVTHRVCPVDKHTACHPNRYRERECIEMTYANHI